MVEKDIGKIKKGEFQGAVTEIVIGIREYNGKVGLDIREFVTSEKYTGPTKKGLRIPAADFLEFREMINSIPLSDMQETPKEKSAEQPKEQKTLDKSKDEMPDY